MLSEHLEELSTWSAEYNSVRYHVSPRFANKRLIAFCMVSVQLYAKITADVESGKMKRQTREGSVNGIEGHSCEK